MEWTKLAVICFIVCAFKCSAKSLNEIEDFSDFLQKTSQLDIILKKGNNPDDDNDEADPVSDHAWEESGKFEGDLILNERQRRLIVEDVAEGLSRNGLKDGTKRWPNNEVIYYIQREHFSGDQVQAIQDGIDDLTQASCVKFRPYKKGDRDAVVIQGSRRGCFSQVGYQSGYQVLNLSGRHPVGRGCFRHGTVIHEFLHTLGFYHMQSSPDRDDYIDVLWENIIEPARHNFRKYNAFSVSDFGVGYDYDSVLHYSRRAFSANGRDTLVPKQGGASIGQRVGLSDKDSQKLNKMYCDADSNNYEAEEDTTKKSATRKKNPKTKPFEGHGIGYHQGKTVVIKLPAAETYKLSDVPSFHMFDYFSKAPQNVLSTLIQGVGVGQEIKHSYNPPVAFNTEEYTAALSDNTHNKSTKPPMNKNENVTKMIKTSEISDGTVSNIEDSGEASIKGADDLNEAFERLGKIIKTHVYPSQTPDLSIYTMPDYSKFYEPTKEFEPESSINDDETFSSALPPIETEAQDYDSGILNQKLSQQFMHMLYDSDIPSYKKVIHERIPDTEKNEKEENQHSELTTMKEDKNSKGMDWSYPLNEEKEVKPTPDYITHHTRLLQHYPHMKESTDSLFKGRHTLFGYVLPLKDNWLKKSQEYKEYQDKYDHDAYFKYLDKNKDNNNYIYAHSLLALRNEDGSEPEKEIAFGPVARSKQAYSIVGVLVPVTQNVYKADYDPHKASYSLRKSESHEDIIK